MLQTRLNTRRLHSLVRKSPYLVAVTGLLTEIEVYSGNGAGKKTLSWLVQTYDLNLDDSPVFLLWTNWTTGSPSGFTSAYFNISKATISSSSSSSSSQLTASSSLQLPSGTSPASQTQSAINGISSETKIGLGVGLGIGIPLLLILSIMLGLQLIKTCRARETSQNQPPPVYLDHQNYEKTAPPATEQVVYYEAPDNRVDALSPRELSGSLVDR